MITSGRNAFIDDGNHDVVTLDLSDPANPERIGNLPLSSLTGIQMALYGDYLFAEANDVFYTIDASSPSALEIVNEHSFRAAIDDETPYIIYPLHIGGWRIKDDYAYLTLYNEGKVAIGVLDISEPTSPREVTMLKLRDRAFGFSMFVSQDNLYLFTRGSMEMLRNNRLEFIDISNPEKPLENGFGIMPDSWEFFPEPSGGSHNTYNLIDNYLYWFIGDSPNLPVIEIFDLSGF
jgi:hypothetical protein